jgi:hypothetical protein
MSRLKEKNMIISIQKNACKKIQYPFMIKILSKLGMEGNFFNLLKGLL